MIAAMTACHNNTNNEDAKKKAMEKVSAPSEQTLEKVATENKKDFICNMPLTAGIGDTANYKGKIYGFCSKECKKEFEKNPTAYIAKAK